MIESIKVLKDTLRLLGQAEREMNELIKAMEDRRRLLAAAELDRYEMEGKIARLTEENKERLEEIERLTDEISELKEKIRSDMARS